MMGERAGPKKGSVFQVRGAKSGNARRAAHGRVPGLSVGRAENKSSFDVVLKPFTGRILSASRVPAGDAGMDFRVWSGHPGGKSA